MMSAKDNNFKLAQQELGRREKTGSADTLLAKKEKKMKLLQEEKNRVDNELEVAKEQHQQATLESISSEESDSADLILTAEPLVSTKQPPTKWSRKSLMSTSLALRLDGAKT